MELAGRLSAAEPGRLDEFIRDGMALNVAAALGVEDLSVASEWVREELSYDGGGTRDVGPASSEAG